MNENPEQIERADAAPVATEHSVAAPSEPVGRSVAELAEEARSDDPVSASTDSTPPSPPSPESEVVDPASISANPAAPAEAPSTERPDEPDDPAASSDASPAHGDATTRSPAGRAQRARAASLYRTFRTRRPIEGKIEKVIKGGYEVRLGRARGFCPHSQIDIERVVDPEQIVGRTALFRITQLRRGGDDVVLSRRVLLEEERVEEAKAVRATLIEGSVMQGRVAGLAPFGAFVNLGAGVMGLVHITEIGHGRAPRVEQIVKVGESVNVKVLKVDEQRNRISLSLRQAQRDPWEGIADRYKVGQVYPGTLSRLADFGAFVALEPEVEALAPASEFPPARLGWKEGLEPGVERNWLVLSVDAVQRRLSVVLAPEEGQSRVEPTVGATLKGRVQRVEKFGVFVWLGPGRVGLMPSALSGTPRGADLSRSFPPADEVEVDVLEIDEDGRRIRLAKAGVRAERVERGGAADPARRRKGPRRAARRETVDGPTQTSTVDSPFGSLLADKLRAALGPDEPRS